VVFELAPFYENIRKRVVKSPKLYFTDAGLAAFLLNLETSDQVARDPVRGGLFENLVVQEVLKEILNRGERPDLFFFRDTLGNEVDLIIREHRTLIPIEIKSAETFSPSFLKGIDRFRKVVGDRCSSGFVVYNGRDSYTLKETEIFNPMIYGFSRLRSELQIT
jgi:predicted AAA+ superfamily ATPase